VSEFLLENLFLLIGEVVHGGNLGRVLGSQSTLLEKRQNVVEVIVRSELLCRTHQSITGHTNERVADSWKGQSENRIGEQISTYSPVTLSVNSATLA
jgi:hypothetical protein